MGTISDLLGIEHFTTSRGSTVRSDFLHAVLDGLGVSTDERAGLSKDRLILAVVEAATGVRPDEHDVLSPGGTVTNHALRLVVDGILATRAGGHDSAVADRGGERPAATFDPSTMRDERERRLVVVAARDGQDGFRTAVLDAYGGRCAITGADAAGALEAAHIFPHQGPATNVVTNGIALRADLHRLFDRGQVAVHEESHEILLHHHLTVTTYRELQGARLRLPRTPSQRPSPLALRYHREWANL